MSQIKFLNHSSILLSSPKTKILCDPWFKGSAFSDGWSLLHDDSHDINKIGFDYIWISHEHPDHFAIATLAELNKPCNFLYQETRDKKVKTFLEKKGHTVFELPNKKTEKFGDLSLTCVVSDGYDSSLIVNFPDGSTLLNINDARVDLDNHLEEEIIPFIKEGDLDLLTFQFSYANWAGNQGDKNIPLHQQDLVDSKNDFVISRLEPKAIMPFASFVYFSHEENFYWNENNWFDHVFNKYSNLNSNLILPKPNQSYSFKELVRKDFSKENYKALGFWKKCHKNLSPKFFSKRYSLKEMEDTYKVFIDELHKKNSIFSFIDKDKNFSLKLNITDLNLVLEVGLLFEEIKVIECPNEQVVADISSEVFISLFSQLFARGTVLINSRINFNYKLAHRFFLFFFIPYANNIGITFNELNKISMKMLESISRTSVMESIVKFNNKTAKNMKNDINALFNSFDFTLKEDPNYEIFNEEPPNIEI